jgi:hypothetical protein
LALAFQKLFRQTIHPHFHLLTKKNGANTRKVAGFPWTINELEDIQK